MSLRVLVIAEDFTHDQFILKPLMDEMLRALGKPQAKVLICREPKLGSVEQATNWQRLEEIIRQQPMIDLFILCVDRDGKEGRQQALRLLEERATAVLTPNRLFLAVNAWQEVETWLLAGMDLTTAWSWPDIRQEPDVKERYFLPYVQQRGLQNELSQGRKTLAKEAAGRYGRIRQLCPELAELETRIQTWLSAIG